MDWNFSEEHKKYLMSPNVDVDSLSAEEISFMHSVDTDGNPIEDLSWECFARESGYYCRICQELPIIEEEHGTDPLSYFNRISLEEDGSELAFLQHGVPWFYCTQCERFYHLNCSRPGMTFAEIWARLPFICCLRNEFQRG